MALLDCPPEILTLIARHLDAKELRTSVEYLLISKRWYRAALPVYLSNLHLSTIYLSSHDLERFPPSHAPISGLIAKKVERLSVRLVGHPSKQIAQNPWHHSGTYSEDGSDDEEVEDKAGWDYWMTVGPISATGVEGGRKSYLWHTEENQLRPWRHRVNKKLLELSQVLPVCKNLTELSFEASSEDDPQLGPRWDYVLGSAMIKTISALPSNLKNLTLDTCGSILVKSEHDRAPMHLCSLIALRLQDFEQVRIRMRHICPQILDTSNNLSDVPSRLKSLVVRLSLPFLPEAMYERHDGYTEFDAKACCLYDSKEPLCEAMIHAGMAFARDIELDIMRITYRPPGSKTTYLSVADCVRGIRLWDPSEVFTYEDDGRAWEAWEDNDEQLRDGSLLSSCSLHLPHFP